MDDKQRIALVETRTVGDEPGVPRRLIRYQFGNHLGSASLELDDDGEVLSYEEYSPYGATTYQAVRDTRLSPKRYRYTGRSATRRAGSATTAPATTPRGWGAGRAPIRSASRAAPTSTATAVARPSTSAIPAASIRRPPATTRRSASPRSSPTSASAGSRATCGSTTCSPATGACPATSGSRPTCAPASCSTCPGCSCAPPGSPTCRVWRRSTPTSAGPVCACRAGSCSASCPGCTSRRGARRRYASPSPAASVWATCRGR